MLLLEATSALYEKPNFQTLWPRTGSKAAATQKMGDLEHLTIHYLRHTFRSHAAEKCLNHKLKGVKGIYDRHGYFDERKRAHQQFSDQIRPFYAIKTFTSSISKWRDIAGRYPQRSQQTLSAHLYPPDEPLHHSHQKRQDPIQGLSPSSATIHCLYGLE